MTNWIEKNNLIEILEETEELPRVDANIRMVKEGKVEDGLANMVKAGELDIKEEDGKIFYRVNLDYANLIARGLKTKFNLNLYKDNGGDYDDC